ncbi:STAS/SEC14 domain-containing protein [Chelativorans sp. AA-79]|uniref:STAS/SEC14 domain-containing protein n=1 Tax=Chelativorans sp. AA-79 TaxID=3028735 RepID=UPI0023F922BB|nr:STAS/SEC14 domain-containing protein [Chelativorans sp. AA-79]WEX11394.1 STAS/SEC14 domain-containing protein [Chelativorans sp. AA-79]
MLINETPPSVRRIDTDRADALAFEITGHIASADIENMYGLLEGAYALHDKIDVIVLIHDYEGADWSAALRGQNLLGRTRTLKHIRKYAVVGAPTWMKATISLAKPFFFSVQMKHFDLEEADAAWTWIGARPLPGPA